MMRLPRITTHENPITGKVEHIISDIYVSPYDIVSVTDAIVFQESAGKLTVEKNNCCIELSNGNSHIIACEAKAIVEIIKNLDQPIDDIEDEIKQLLN